ncbi:MAG: DEAD/DEAH box helicase, partial [Chloroflexi bacterium]
QQSASFTYSSETPLLIGQIVTIEVGKKTVLGIVVSKVEKPAYDTKLISEVVDETALPEPLLRLAEWMSSYYSSHLATVLQTILPRGLLKKRRDRTTKVRESLRGRTTNVLTDAQQLAIQTIESSTPGSILLHGVTGSGKTTIYIESAKKALARGESVIILVPEIALTSQLVDEFSHHFSDIILTHSRQTEAERHLSWLSALHAEL